MAARLLAVLVRTAEKEKERPNKEGIGLEINTAASFLKMTGLQKQNEANVVQTRQDSVKLVRNTRELELHQRRRVQLSALNCS